MATKISQVVGKPFSKKVQEEFNRRKGLEQTYSNTSELYQPYFTIRRLNSMKPVTSQELDTTDFYRGKFSKLGKIFSDDDIDFTYGLDEIEDQSPELRGFPQITSVTFELEDFTFYRATINFEIPDVSHFKDFKDTWLQFGAPIIMEWGRYSPVGFEDQNEDLLPNKEVRLGNIVRFEYNMEGGGKAITGSLIIYSVTWLPVLQEGSQENEESGEFKDLMVEYLVDSVENPMTLVNHSYELRNYFWGVHKEGFNTSILPVRGYFGGGTMAIDVTPQARHTGGEYIHTLDGLDTESVIKKVDKDYSNINSIEEFINCHFSLDPEQFGIRSYYFISLGLIEKFLNKYYSYLSDHGNIDDESIFKFDLSNTVINNYELSGIRSRLPDQVLINPREFTYRFDNEKNEYVRDLKNGELFLSRDIFISATSFLRILNEVRGGYSFVEEMGSLIKMATSSIINFDTKREDGIYINGNILINGISYIDSSTIVDNESDTYTTFKLHHPEEKLSNVNFATEISDEISNMIFFRSRGDNLSNDSGYEEQFLFTKQLNLRHVKEIMKDKLNSLVDKVNEIRNDTSSPLPLTGYLQYRQLVKTQDYFNKLEDTDDIPIKYNQEKNEWVIKGINENDYKLEEFHSIRMNLIRKTEIRFDNLYNDISRRVSDNINSRTLRGDISKSDILNILTFLQYYFSHTLDFKNKEYYTQHNYKMPYTLSFEVDGISGIVPSQAFKVDLSSFPVDYNENQNALFVVTGLSHTFDGNNWTTAINGSFWIDFKKQTFLNSYQRGNLSELITAEYMNTMASLIFIFKTKLKSDLQNYQNISKFLTDINFEDAIQDLWDDTIINIVK